MSRPRRSVTSLRHDWQRKVCEPSDTLQTVNQVMSTDWFNAQPEAVKIVQTKRRLIFPFPIFHPLHLHFPPYPLLPLLLLVTRLLPFLSIFFPLSFVSCLLPFVFLLVLSFSLHFPSLFRNQHHAHSIIWNT